MMKRILVILSALILAVSSCSFNATVKGRVTCEGRGLRSVVVSDGVCVTKTGLSGRYRLNSKKENGYVFISIPSGYEVDSKGLLPQFYAYLAGNKVDTANFELRKVDQSSYTMFVMTDIHLTGDEVDKDLPEFHKSFLPGICEAVSRTEGPVYSMCLGDMTTDGKWYKNHFAFQEYLREMSAFPVPIFHVMGNHDNERKGKGDWQEWDSIGETRYKKEMGPNYYSMNIGSYHYLMLDDIITTGPKSKDNPAQTYVGKFGFTYAIDTEQMEWIKKDLSYVPKDMGIVIAMHVPFWQICGLKDGELQYKYTAASSYDPQPLLDLVSGWRDVQFLTGHWHHTEVIPIADNITEHVHCSASAVSWKINDIGAPMVCDDGTPAGCQIYKVEGDRMSWQYKSNYKSVEESQCNVYEMDNDTLLVNVFNWDKYWDVRVLEDGIELPLEQIWDYDPMYLQIRSETKTLLNRPTAFREEYTLHLFRCVRKSSESEIDVIITDRFGNVYHSKPGQMAV